ncbi:MAG: TetR/AcrR family transcriptional regulator [Deltaproteobacteria bacterium]|nr:TetR/AcrR family transcriptional regulator [Deltaproteobacteria bacterium]
MAKKTIEEKREKSIQSILNAAREIFAEKGFAGARVDEIAERAHVNKAMIYYRLGDKKELYSQALHDILGDAVERITQAIKNDDSAEDKLKKYIRNLSHAMKINPFLPRIMMREIASGGYNLPEVVIKDILRILDVLTGIIKEGLENDIFIKINPFTLHIMIISALVLLKGSSPVRNMYSSLLSKYINPEMENDSFTAKEIENLLLRAVIKDQKNEIFV